MAHACSVEAPGRGPGSGSRSVKLRVRYGDIIFIVTAHNEDLAVGQQGCRRRGLHHGQPAGLPKFKRKTGARLHEGQRRTTYEGWNGDASRHVWKG